MVVGWVVTQGTAPLMPVLVIVCQQGWTCALLSHCCCSLGVLEWMMCSSIDAASIGCSNCSSERRQAAWYYACAIIAPLLVGHVQHCNYVQSLQKTVCSWTIACPATHLDCQLESSTSPLLCVLHITPLPLLHTDSFSLTGVICRWKYGWRSGTGASSCCAAIPRCALLPLFSPMSSYC